MLPQDIAATEKYRDMHAITSYDSDQPTRFNPRPKESDGTSCTQGVLPENSMSLAQNMVSVELIVEKLLYDSLSRAAIA